MSDTLKREPVGIAVIGAGRIGTMRTRLASEHPAVNFIAVSDLKRDAAQALADKTGAGVPLLGSVDNFKRVRPYSACSMQRLSRSMRRRRAM